MSEQEEPRQLTVAELLARHGRFTSRDAETGARQDASETSDPQNGSTAQTGSPAGTPQGSAAETPQTGSTSQTGSPAGTPQGSAPETPQTDSAAGTPQTGVAGASAANPNDEQRVAEEAGPLDEQMSESEIPPEGVSGSHVSRIRESARRRRNAREDRREGPDERTHRTAYQRHPALRALVVLGVILVLLAGYYTVVLLIAQSAIERVDVLRTSSADVIDRAAQSGSNTSLMVVADSGSGGDNGAQITALVHESADDSTLTIVSFPRRMLIDMPPCGTSSEPVEPAVTTIETAYALGGPRCSVAAIQAATGIRIDHYIGFDLARFPDMIDALGGISICLRAPLTDPALGLDLPAGESTLDGNTATNYVRAVNGGSGDDPARADRQIDFLNRLFAKVADIRTLANPIAVTQFAFASGDALRLDPDTSLGDLRRLGSALRGDSDATIAIVVPPLSPDVQQLPGTDIAAVRMQPVYARTMFDAIIAGQTVEASPGGEASNTEAAPPAAAPATTEPAAPAVDC